MIYHDADGTRCPACGEHHIVGVEIWGRYDGVLYWECPACGTLWHRFPEHHRLHELAEPYVSGAKPDLNHHAGQRVAERM